MADEESHGGRGGDAERKGPKVDPQPPTNISNQLLLCEERFDLIQSLTDALRIFSRVLKIPDLLYLY